MNKIETINWLKKKMLGINANNGTTNCSLVALRLDSILNQPDIVFTEPVPLHDPKLITQPVYTQDGKSIIKSFCYDPRILERCSLKYIKTYDLTNDVLIQNASETEMLATTLKFIKTNRSDITKNLVALPRRINDGSAHGFIIYTHLATNQGHIINFLVDAADNVYFLDAQPNHDPDLFISFEPASGYMDDIFYIQSIPAEGFMHFKQPLEQSLSEEDIIMKNQTTESSMSGRPSSSSDSAAAALPTTLSGRKRKAPDMLIPNFGPASRTRYDLAAISFDDNEETVGVHSNDDQGGAIAPIDEIVDERPNSSSSYQYAGTKSLDFIGEAHITAAIQSDLLEEFQKLLKKYALADVCALKLNHNRQKYSLIQYLIKNEKLSFIVSAIKIGVPADHECLENFMKKSLDIDTIEVIVQSLFNQRILIKPDLIKWLSVQKKPFGYDSGYIPQLCKDLESHNISLNTAASTTETAVPNTDDAVHALLLMQSTAATETVSHTESVAPPAASAVVNTHVSLIHAPSLAQLRKMAERNKVANEAIKSDFDSYKIEADKLIAILASLSSELHDYTKLMLEHQNLKNKLWADIQQFKDSNEDPSQVNDFFIKQLPDVHAQYRKATDQNRKLEFSVADDLSQAMKAVNCEIPALTHNDVDPQSYGVVAINGSNTSFSPLIEENDLYDQRKILELIEKISAQYKKDIDATATLYIANCAKLVQLLPSIKQSFGNYKTILSFHKHSSERLLTTVNSFGSAAQTNFEQTKVLFEQFCPDLYANFNRLTATRRGLRLTLQEHLHNAMILRKKRGLDVGSPNKLYSATSTTTVLPAPVYVPNAPAYSPSMPAYAPAFASLTLSQTATFNLDSAGTNVKAAESRKPLFYGDI